MTDDLVSLATLIAAGVAALAAVAATKKKAEFLERQNKIHDRQEQLQASLSAQQMQLQGEQREIHARQRDALRDMEEFSSRFMAYALKATPAGHAEHFERPFEHRSRSSLFEVRRSHFGPEKERLADKMVDVIRDRLHSNDARSIILVLDGGSTVYPIFQKLCLHPDFRFDPKVADRLSIVTNNLPGVSDLTKFGRIGDKRSARTLFQCRVLGGFADSSYEAALSDESADELRQALEKEKQRLSEDTEEIEIVSVTTGNYLSVPDGILTRNPEHEEIKQGLIIEASRVYILAPLGKILPFTAEEVNEMLNLEDSRKYGSEVHWDSIGDKLHVIATVRPDAYFQAIRPAGLAVHLSHAEATLREKFSGRLTEIIFDPIDSARVRMEAAIVGKKRAFREYELPHRDLRDSLLRNLPGGNFSRE